MPTRYPYHAAIKQQQPDGVVRALKNGTSTDVAVDQIDAYGMTALQLAAAEGMVEVLLWLIYAGASVDLSHVLRNEQDTPLQACQKPPLYFAMQNQHELCCQLLLALGADTNKSLRLAEFADDANVSGALIALTLDHATFRNVLYWAVSHYQPLYHTHLLDLLQRQISVAAILSEDEKTAENSQRLLPSLPSQKIPLHQIQQDLSALAEKAMKNGQVNVVAHLLRMNQQFIRTNNHVAHLGYWAAQQPEDHLYHTYLQNDDDGMILSLQQLWLHASDEVFNRIFAKASPRQQQLFLQKTTVLDSQHILTEAQQKIYHCASFNKKNTLKQLLDHYQASNSHLLECLLEYSLHEKNFVALELLLAHYPIAAALAYAIQTRQQGLLSLLMFHSDQFPFQILQKIPQTIHVSFHDFQRRLTLNAQQGLMYQVISHGLRNRLRDDRPIASTQQQQAYFKAIHCQPDDFLKTYVKRLYVYRSINPPVNTQCFSLEESHVVIEHALRFGIQLTEKALPQRANHHNRFLSLMCSTRFGPVQTLLAYCDNRSQTHFFMSAKTTYKFQHETQHKKIDRFLTHLQQACQQYPYCYQRNYHAITTRAKISMALFILAWLLIVPCLIGAIDMHRQLTALTTLFNDTPYALDPTLRCNIFLNAKQSMCTEPSPYGDLANCADLCNALQQSGFNYLSLVAFGISTPGMLALVTMIWALPGFYQCTKISCQGQERLDSLALTTFPAAVQDEARDLFHELQQRPSSNDYRLRLPAPLKDVRDALQHLKHQPSHYSLRFFKAANTQEATSECEEKKHEEQTRLFNQV